MKAAKAPWPYATAVASWLATLALGLLLVALRGGPDLSEFRIEQAREFSCDGSELRSIAIPHFTWGKDCRRLLISHSLDPEHRLGQSLLISGVGRDARIWINGQPLHDFDPRAAFDSTSHSLLLPLPSDQLQGGEIELLLQLRGGASWLDRSYLGSVFLGPEELLSPAYQRMRSVGNDGARLAVVVAVAILLTILPMSLQRPQESRYRWFALAVLFSLVYLWNMGWPLRPLPSVLWHGLTHAALALALWAMLRLSLALGQAGDRLRRWSDRLTALALLALLVKVVVTAYLPVTVAELLYRGILLAQLLLLALLWWRRRQTEALAHWMAAAALLNVVLGLADSLRVLQSIAGTLAPYLLHWGILYLLVLLLITQVRGILRALHVAENAQEQLQAALAERSLELQQQFALRQQAEQARTLAEERQRIMRDMHDGVGGQLVALIGQLEHNALDPADCKRQLRLSLDDLRLMIDSLDDACGDLGVALGMLRQRLQSTLKDLPVEVSWRTAQLPDLAPRAPDEVLQVLRIVQEAITNALRHADCQQLQIIASWEDGQICIEVRDDGRGLAAGQQHGRGLPSMRARAERIGGWIEWVALNPGTCVRLSLPQRLAAA